MFTLNDLPRNKFLPLFLAVLLATLIIIFPCSIFLASLKTSYGFLTDTTQGDIWVVGHKTQNLNALKSLRSSALTRVRGVEGVAWAVPILRSTVKAKLRNGDFYNCKLIGIDAATLIGGPPNIFKGTILNLRQPDAVIVNDTKLQIGQTFELGEKRAVVAGFFDATPSLENEPIIYTTYSRAISYSPHSRNTMSLILVKGLKNINLHDLTTKIQKQTGLDAYTKEEFQKMNAHYNMENNRSFIGSLSTILLLIVIAVAILGFGSYLFCQTGFLSTREAFKQGLLTTFLGFGCALLIITFLYGLISFSFPIALLGISLICISVIIIISIYINLKLT